MYNPTVGVFATEDPTGFDAGDDNLYRFVGNDPANAKDPTGTVLIGEVIGKAAADQYLQDINVFLFNAGVMETIRSRVEAEIDEDIAPYAIRLAVLKALRALGVTGVTVSPGDTLKAKITEDGYNTISKTLGDKLVPATTKSGDKAWAAQLGGNWELKVYLKGTQYSAAVGHTTDSIDHYMDFLQYKLKGLAIGGPGGSGAVAIMSTYPNGANAEAYLGKPVYSWSAAVELKSYKDKGFVSEKMYNSIIKGGIFLGFTGDGQHMNGNDFKNMEIQWGQLGIPGYPTK